MIHFFLFLTLDIKILGPPGPPVPNNIFFPSGRMTSAVLLAAKAPSPLGLAANAVLFSRVQYRPLSFVL
ncbi:MAG: hypothetical protein ACJ73N_17675 [Bryobacteraceae bacterium]